VIVSFANIYAAKAALSLENCEGTQTGANCWKVPKCFAWTVLMFILCIFINYYLLLHQQMHI